MLILRKCRTRRVRVCTGFKSSDRPDRPTSTRQQHERRSVPGDPQELVVEEASGGRRQEVRTKASRRTEALDRVLRAR